MRPAAPESFDAMGECVDAGCNGDGARHAQRELGIHYREIRQHMVALHSELVERSWIGDERAAACLATRAGCGRKLAARGPPPDHLVDAHAVYERLPAARQHRVKLG